MRLSMIFGEILMSSNDLGAGPHVFTVESKSAKEAIKKELIGLFFEEMKNEAYCDYVLCYVTNKKRLVVKQYQSGKLVVQGKNEDVINDVLNVIRRFVDTKEQDAKDSLVIEAPIIGTDESGKGDYFGPLVVCAIWADDAMLEVLNTMGVKDSKTLSNDKCDKIAQAIREKYEDKFVEIVLLPEEYNSLYQKFKTQGKALNQMLGYLHAQAINKLYANYPAKNVLIDKFGKESDVEAYLVDSIDSQKVTHSVKGERNTAVAAASIIARDRFVKEMNRMSLAIDMQIPLGAGSGVLEFATQLVRTEGKEKLKSLAKWHFVTTEQAIINSGKLL